MKKEWLISPDGLPPASIDWAEEFGKQLANKKGDLNPLTTTQFRRFFNNLKRLQAELNSNANSARVLSKLVQLKPLLAYAVGKDRDPKLQRPKTQLIYLYNELTAGIDVLSAESSEKGGVPPSQTIHNFVDLVQAIVAYHKFHGGKDQ